MFSPALPHIDLERAEGRVRLQFLGDRPVSKSLALFGLGPIAVGGDLASWLLCSALDVFKGTPKGRDYVHFCK